MDIIKASNKLSQLELEFSLDNYQVAVLWFRVMELRGAWCISRHTHSSYEFHFVADGKCRVRLDDGEFVAGKGEFYVTAPGVYHEQSSIDDGGYTEYSMNCDLVATGEEDSELMYLAEAFRRAPCKAYADSFDILGDFTGALNEALEEHLGYYTAIKSLVALILAKAARTVSGNGSRKTAWIPQKNNYNDMRFRQIEKYMEDNVCNAIASADIAQYMHLSEKQVLRIVQNKAGVSTKQLLCAIKLRKAKELLHKTNLQQKEIAHMLGFSSEYYFNQFFSREEGQPPGQYRINVKDV